MKKIFPIHWFSAIASSFMYHPSCLCTICEDLRTIGTKVYFLFDLLQRAIEILHFYFTQCGHSCGIDCPRIRIDGKHLFPGATKLNI